MANSKFDKLVEAQEKLQKTIQYLIEKEEASLIEWDIVLEKTRLLYEVLTDIKLVVLSKGTTTQEKVSIQEEKKVEKNLAEKEPIIEEEISEVKEEIKVAEKEDFEEETIAVEKEPVIVASSEGNEEAVKSLNDILVDIQNNMDLATKLQNLPIEKLEEAISLNDKIWFVRDLFNGDNELYNRTIQNINKANTIGDAVRVVQGLSWDKEESATKAFFELIYRKFTR